MLLRSAQAQPLRSLSLLAVNLPEPSLRALETAGAIVHSEEVGARAWTDLIIFASDLNGADISLNLAAWRARGDAPILVLCPGSSEWDRVQALDAGADHLISEPCSDDELVARAAAAMRRPALVRAEKARIRLEGLEVDLVSRRFFLEGEETHLSRREHDLLCFLARHPGRPIAYRQIIDAVWGPGARVESQYVRVLVAQLRQRLEADPARPALLVTEPGLGYRLALLPASA